MPDLAAIAAEAEAHLTRAGLASDDARRDTAVLIRHVLGWTAAEWMARRRETVEDDVAVRAATLVERRANHEPVAYLTGTREFYGGDFLVTRDVLIPRPETELVVDQALGALDELARPTSGVTRAPRVVDVGTGSGCLAITIALERRHARVVATDVSSAALDVARRNVERYGVGERVTLRMGPLFAWERGPFDLVVSNPPYVARRDRAALAPDVRDYEPDVALFGGDDGLDVIRALLPAAAAALAPGGALVMEIGAGQDGAVVDLVTATPGLTVVRIVADLQAIPRVVIVRRDDASS